MADSGLLGPFPLTQNGIDANVKGIGPGAYALGEKHDDGLFYIFYAGRSDNNLNSRLHDHESEYKQFKYGFFQTAEKAYRKECFLYHTFNPRDNEIHPAAPKGTNLKCNWSGCNF